MNDILAILSGGDYVSGEKDHLVRVERMVDFAETGYFRLVGSGDEEAVGEFDGPVEKDGGPYVDIPFENGYCRRILFSMLTITYLDPDVETCEAVPVDELLLAGEELIVDVSLYDTIDESLPGLLFLGWGGDAYRGYAVGAEGLYLQDRKAGVDQTALTGVEVLHRFVGI